jgi:phage terminase large subunit
MPLSKPQETIANDTHRFRVAICGRRFGKTHLSIRELCKFARFPETEVFYVAPSYRQAKQIVWKKLKRKLIELRWAKKVNETELSITLKNNSTISLKGADNFDSLRGVGLDFLVLDEFADIDPDAWYEVLRPALADREGSALFIGTPKGKGNWSFELFQQQDESPDQWTSFQYTTLEGGQVTAEEIESAKRDLDERSFRQEFLATFETYGNVIAYNFKREIHVKQIPDPRLHELHVGIDFNNTPITAAIMYRDGNTMYQFDEVYINDSNTGELADEIKRRYPSSRIVAYPDPAGRQRKTSANGQTDFTILSNAGFTVKAPNSHNQIRDRINSMNARLKTVDGQIHYYVDPRCKHTIESLEKYAYKEGTQQPDKNSGYDHMFDALSYCIDYLFPIKRDYEAKPQQRFTHRIS